MEDLRVGALLRTARRKRALRQIDVAALAGVSQQTVSRVERGRFDLTGLRALRAVAAALGISLPFEPRAAGGERPGLADARHAAIVQALVRQLIDAGWKVRVEYSYNLYGEKGCIDVLAWREDACALLIAEVKSELVDAQALLRSVDTRDRVLRRVVPRELGWRPECVASVVVFADESYNRRSVAKLASVFDAALPARTVAVKHWIAHPKGDLRGISFLSATTRRRAQRNPGGRGRVRRNDGSAAV